MLFQPVSLLYPPISDRIGGQLGTAAEVVILSGNQIGRAPGVGVEMGVVGISRGVNGNEHAFPVALAFPDSLMVGQQHMAEAAVGQRLAFCSTV